MKVEPYKFYIQRVHQDERTKDIFRARGEDPDHLDFNQYFATTDEEVFYTSDPATYVLEEWNEDEYDLAKDVREATEEEAKDIYVSFVNGFAYTANEEYDNMRPEDRTKFLASMADLMREFFL